MSIPQSKEDLKSSLHHHSTANPTPTHTTSKHTPLPPPTSTSSYITFPMTYAVSGILRRLSSDTHNTKSSSRSSSKSNAKNMEHFAPPYRKPSPFQPPPLTPLLLSGWSSGTKENARLLTRALAEEIRLLVPARLQLEENWRLIFSLEQNGTSLATLFEKSEDYRGKRGGYVLVIRDGLGGVRILPLRIASMGKLTIHYRFLAHTSLILRIRARIIMARGSAFFGDLLFSRLC